MLLKRELPDRFAGHISMACLCAAAGGILRHANVAFRRHIASTVKAFFNRTGCSFAAWLAARGKNSPSFTRGRRNNHIFRIHEGARTSTLRNLSLWYDTHCACARTSSAHVAHVAPLERTSCLHEQGCVFRSNTCSEALPVHRR
jgi:hypothetical protein